MSGSCGAHDRPVPEVALATWLDALARTGWSGARTHPVTEHVPVAAGLGRVTATPVHARYAAPRCDCAAMDGIAVAAADVAVAAPADPAGADGGAGAGRVWLPRAAFEWIDTGDPMPTGADTVLERERVVPRDGGVVVSGGTVTAGRNVRTVGEDFAAGQLLLPAGRRLHPADLAAAAAGGHAALAVARQPTVAIIPTGDEIRPPGAALRRGEITDTNSLMLAARCQQAGARPAVSEVQPDDPDVLAAEVRRAAADAELVLVLSGSSRGRDDHTAAVLAQTGGVAVAGVAVRPGHPVLLGHVKPGEASGGEPAGPVPAIGVPGYPLAAAVVFELFALPLLAAAGGWRPVADTRLAVLDRDWTSPPGMEDWVPVTLTRSGDGLLATPARRGAGSVSQLIGADAWWPVPADRGRVPAGTPIEVRPIG